MQQDNLWEQFWRGNAYAVGVIHCSCWVEGIMAQQAGFWSVDDRLAAISAGGDPLEALNATVDFERFRPILERSAGRLRIPSVECLNRRQRQVSGLFSGPG
ncbi:hypothetical protein [Leisingera daeponensis]|uniref:hypothetical protein n=1 Tax=Leisingera daeponensis TaxID=405746 RepID=UPI001C9527DA|nr:hypothetical protein [Leisingera daeponensis]MBY6059778.1 hypothetical protein [Leisingera daeponensis]